ncbi:MAG: MotA/TolQ/ExbB proton channel family protein [Phycisphaerales bacterium]
MIRRTGPAAVVLGMFAAGALAQGGSPAVEPDGGKFGVWKLFWQSADFFTVLLVAGSVAAVWIIVKCLLEIRPSTISGRKSTIKIGTLIEDRNWGELRRFVERDGALTSVVVREAIGQSGRGREAMRESAEIAASVECSKWFRKIEPLNIIGNLGPLVGLAGTVWGMILAFTTLGVEGGQAGPASLSLGISKALFHTLLGLLLAIPCLLVFGLYRGVVDRICNRAMADAARFVERLPSEEPGDAGAGADEASEPTMTARKRA